MAEYSYEATQYGLFDRSKWTRGPWDSEPDLVAWWCNGLECQAKRNGEMGTWCGYIRLPPGRRVPEQITLSRLSVHGGVSWDGPVNFLCTLLDEVMATECFLGRVDTATWIGWDCNHHGDYCPRWPRLGTTYRDLDFVRAETDGLARQILGTQ